MINDFSRGFRFWATRNTDKLAQILADQKDEPRIFNAKGPSAPSQPEDKLIDISGNKDNSGIVSFLNSNNDEFVREAINRATIFAGSHDVSLNKSHDPEKTYAYNIARAIGIDLNGMFKELSKAKPVDIPEQEKYDACLKTALQQCILNNEKALALEEGLEVIPSASTRDILRNDAKDLAHRLFLGTMKPEEIPTWLHSKETIKKHDLKVDDIIGHIISQNPENIPQYAEEDLDKYRKCLDLVMDKIMVSGDAIDEASLPDDLQKTASLLFNRVLKPENLSEHLQTRAAARRLGVNMEFIVTNAMREIPRNYVDLYTSAKEINYKNCLYVAMHNILFSKEMALPQNLDASGKLTTDARVDVTLSTKRIAPRLFSGALKEEDISEHLRAKANADKLGANHFFSNSIDSDDVPREINAITDDEKNKYLDCLFIATTKVFSTYELSKRASQNPVVKFNDIEDRQWGSETLKLAAMLYNGVIEPEDIHETIDAYKISEKKGIDLEGIVNEKAQQSRQKPGDIVNYKACMQLTMQKILLDDALSDILPGARPNALRNEEGTKLLDDAQNIASGHQMFPER